MSTVDKVIFDALAKRRDVVLPGAGTLQVKRRKARKISETRIIPPRNVVVFNPEELSEGVPVTDLLKATGGANEEDARAIYESWLENARSNGGLHIKDVGELKDGKFVTAQPMHILLNPSGEDEAVVMGRERRGGPLWLWILGGIILAALIILLLSWYGRNDFLGLRNLCKAPKAEVVMPAPLPEPDVVEEPQSTSEEIIAETLKKSAEPRFHVIAGSFAVESNADDHIKKLQKDFPELTFEKVRNSRNGNWLVSIFSAPTERQAYNKMNMYWDIDLDIWVYEEK